MSTDDRPWLARPLLPWPIEVRPLPFVLIVLGIGLFAGVLQRLSGGAAVDYVVVIDLITGLVDFGIAAVLEWRYRADE